MNNEKNTAPVMETQEQYESETYKEYREQQKANQENVLPKWQELFHST